MTNYGRCSHCEAPLSIPDYVGHYDKTVFIVKGYNCPVCLNRYRDRSPLKSLRWTKDGWKMVELDTRIYYQKWIAGHLPATKAGTYCE